MDLAKLVRDGVATADRLTATLQVTLGYTPVVSRDVFGKPDYGADQPFPMQALMDRTHRVVRGREATDVVSTVSVTFLQPGVTVDFDDKIFLPGSLVPARIEAIEAGLSDPQTDAGYLAVVRLA